MDPEERRRLGHLLVDLVVDRHLRNKSVLRLCKINPLTTEADIATTIDWLAAARLPLQGRQPRLFVSPRRVSGEIFHNFMSRLPMPVGRPHAGFLHWRRMQIRDALPVI